MENSDFFKYKIGDVLLIKGIEGKFFTGFLSCIEIIDSEIFLTLSSVMGKNEESECDFRAITGKHPVSNIEKITRLRAFSTVDSIGDF